MKRKKGKLLLALVGSLVALISGVQNVSASTLTYDFTGYWYERSDNGADYSSWRLEDYKVDGNIAFCIEPGIPEGTDQYRQVDWSATGLSNEVKQKVLLYSYYGYQYTGHQNLNYRAATQALIWESILGGNTRVSFNTARYGAGTSINVDAERAEIERLVNSHYVKPSFNGTTITSQVGIPTTLTDTNNVLSNYEVYASNGAEISINGNQLTITPTQIGTVNLTFVKKQIYSRSYLVYFADGYQNMISGGNIDPVFFGINLQGLGGQVEMNKVDSKTNTNQVQKGSTATLQGATYGIYDLSDNLIQTITTDENGYAKSDYLPRFEKYYIKEIKASEGYKLSDEKIYFESTKDDLLVYVKAPENIITRDYEITKIYSSDKTMIMTPEVNVEFGLYDSNNELYGKYTTDNEGKIYFTAPYGKFTLKQLTSTSGYEKIGDYHFEIKEQGPTINKVFGNGEITARLKVIKIDDSGNIITQSGIKFKIKDLSTGKYVCQRVSYPNAITYCEFETNEDGMLITPYPLNSGNYELEELDQVVYGYVWNSTPLKFSINEKSNIISSDEFDAILEVKFENKEVKGSVEIDKIGEELVIEDDTYTYEEIKLPNVKFGLYDENGNLVKEVITDKNGKAKIEGLKLGKYILKELESSNNNILDTTDYEFELVYKDQYTPIVIKTFNLKNYLGKGTLEFSKTDLTTGKVIPNVEIKIYTENDELVYTGRTDENGKIKIDDLFEGKFYIVETEAATGYRLSDEKVLFEIKENGKVVKANMTNEKFKGTLEFSKVDFSTSEPLPNTLIEIHNAETDEIIFSGRTDENGKIIIENIEYGKYYIIEKEAPEGYVLNDEKMYFEILEDGQIVKSTMTNNKIEMPKTFNTDLVSILIIGGTALVGLGLLVYAKKKDE